MIMKMRELVDRTGMAKEKIHLFKREGMLPAIEKTSPNQAIYNEKHVERINLIQDLQEKYFIPITVIKKIVRQLETSPEEEELLAIKTGYFQPTDHFLPREIRGEDEFLKFIDLPADRILELERWGIIRPAIENGVKVYDHDNIKLGKLFGDMRKTGLGYDKGYSQTWVMETRDMLLPIVDHARKTLKNGFKNTSATENEMKNLNRKAVEYIPIILYHMGRILLKDGLLKY